MTRVDILKKTEHLTKNNKPYFRLLLQSYNETGAPQEPQSYALFDYIAGQKLEVGESWNCDLSSTINPAGGWFNNLDTVNSRLDPAPSSAPSPASPASPAAVAPAAPPLGGSPTATTPTIEVLWNELPAHSGGRAGMTGQNLSIEHQVALKEARLAAEFLLSQEGATADVQGYLRTWNLMYMGSRKMLNGQAKDLLRELLAKQAPPPPAEEEELNALDYQALGG